MNKLSRIASAVMLSSVVLLGAQVVFAQENVQLQFFPLEQSGGTSRTNTALDSSQPIVTPTPLTLGGQNASAPRRIRNLHDLVDFIRQVINGTVIPFIFLIALIYFLWNGYEYVSQPDTKKGMKLVYGIIGLFAMVSVWGLVNLVAQTFQLDNTPLNVDEVILR